MAAGGAATARRRAGRGGRRGRGRHRGAAALEAVELGGAGPGAHPPRRLVRSGRAGPQPRLPRGALDDGRHRRAAGAGRGRGRRPAGRPLAAERGAHGPRAPVAAAGVIFGVGLTVATVVVALPLSIARYAWGRHYGIVTQPVPGWLLDLAKGLGLQAVIAGAVGAAAAVAISRLPGRGGRRWRWGPRPWSSSCRCCRRCIFEPLFQRTEPLRDPALSAQILELAQREGVSADDVKVNDASARAPRPPTPTCPGSGAAATSCSTTTCCGTSPATRCARWWRTSWPTCARRHVLKGSAWAAALLVPAALMCFAVVGWRTGFAPGGARRGGHQPGAAAAGGGRGDRGRALGGERAALELDQPRLRARGRLARPARLPERRRGDRPAAGAGEVEPRRPRSPRPCRCGSAATRTRSIASGWPCGIGRGSAELGRRAPRLQLAVVGKLRAPHDGPGRLTRSASTAWPACGWTRWRPSRSSAARTGARAAEAERLRARLLPRALRVALDPAGPPRPPARTSPPGSARRMDERPVAFLVGGALGLAPDLVARGRRAPLPGPADAAPPARARGAGRAALPRALHHGGAPLPALTAAAQPVRAASSRS